MITGFILVLLSFIAFYIIYKTDLEDVVIENESFGKLKLYLGVLILFVLGVVSILNNK